MIYRYRNRLKTLSILVLVYDGVSLEMKEYHVDLNIFYF